jgi:hypothetical protein
VGALRGLVRSGASPFPWTLERSDHPSLFGLGGGERHCVIATGDFDLVEAAPEVRTRQLRAFEDVLGSLRTRLQLFVASRRRGNDDIEDVELRAFLEARAPTFERRVYLVLTDGPAVAARLGATAKRVLRREGGEPKWDLGVLLDQAAALEDLLRSMQLQPRLLAGRELDTFLDRHLPTVAARRGVSADWKESPEVLELDDTSVRSWFLESMPGSELGPGWLGDLLDLRCEYDLSIHLSLVPPGSVIRLLNTRIRDLQAARMADGAAGGVGDPMVEAGLPEALGMRRMVASNQGQALTASVYLSVLGDGDGVPPNIPMAVETAAARVLAKVLPATLQQAPARSSTLPVGDDRLGRERLLPAETAATLFPWTWKQLRQPAGHLVGFDRRGDAPILLDTFDESVFANANIGVFGHSGSGKTYLMKAVLAADAAAGTGAFILDPEAEYRNLCEAVGGQYVDLALGSGHSINVMDRSLAQVGERDALGDQVSDIVDLLGTMCGALTDLERGEVDDVLKTVLSSGGTLADLRAGLGPDLAPRVWRALRRWTDGPLGETFSRPTNVRLQSDFVVFGLRDVKEEFLPVAYFLIAQWIWARVRSQPQRRRVLFDEVGLLFDYPLVRKFLVRLARRIRKYNGSLCLVTQNGGDLLSSDQGLVLATNPSTIFLGSQRPAEALRLQRAYGLTDSQAAYLGAARRGQFLLLAGEGRYRLNVEVAPGCGRLAAL